MSSEPDSTPHRRPPTIDLTATEIDSGARAQPPGGTDGGSGAAAERGAWHFAGGMGPLAIGAGAGAIVVAAVAFGLWFAGLVPGGKSPPANNAQAGGDISEQLDKIQAELASQRSVTTITARVASIEAQLKSVGDSVAALNRRVDDVAVSAQSARERADAASASAKDATQGTVQKSDIDALATRIASLERTVSALVTNAAHRVAGAPDRAVRLAVVAEALRAAVERGASYKSELSAVETLGVDRGATAPLEQFAAGGVPSAAQLANELAQLAPALAAASGSAASGGSFLGRLEDHAKGLVRITPVDAPAGDAPAAVLARIDAAADRADLAAALADIMHLPDAAKTLAGPWVAKVQARDAAVAASRRIAAAALAGLATADAQ